MKITLNQLLAAETMIKNLQQKKLKAKTAWALLKVAKKVEEESTQFSQLKDAKIAEYGDLVNEQMTISPESENWNVFVSEMNEVLNTTMEVEFSQISIDLIEDLEIGINELYAVEWLFTE